MNTSPKKFRVTLRNADDGSDACILPIPDALIAELTWKDGDTLTIEKMSDDDGQLTAGAVARIRKLADPMLPKGRVVNTRSLL